LVLHIKYRTYPALLNEFFRIEIEVYEKTNTKVYSELKDIDLIMFGISKYKTRQITTQHPSNDILFFENGMFIETNWYGSYIIDGKDYTLPKQIQSEVNKYMRNIKLGKLLD
jgi:hypothetical protein